MHGHNNLKLKLKKKKEKKTRTKVLAIGSVPQKSMRQKSVPCIEQQSHFGGGVCSWV